MQRQRSRTPQPMLGPTGAADPMQMAMPGQSRGMGNAAMQERVRAMQMGEQGAGAGQEQAPARFAGQEQLLASIQGEPLIATNVDDFIQSNLYKAMVRLVDKEGWDPEFAASWLGQAVVETGKKNLEELDVVEQGARKGRGMMQYSYSRRGPYDRARQQAIRSGTDPNDINWQIDYALNGDDAGLNFDALRQGLTDPNQNYRFNPRWGTATGFSPRGVPYGNKFSDANSLMAAYGDDRVAGYTRALSGEYTRPGKPHMNRRLAATRRILQMYQKALKQNDPLNQLGGMLV